MLTEIEWWGGLLFVWGGICYYWFINEFGWKLNIDTIPTQLVYLTSAFVLALYFYPLENYNFQITYISTEAVLILSMLFFFFWPESETKKAETQKNQDEEEISKGMEKIAVVIFSLPSIVACLLGAYKSYGMLKVLNILS